MTSKTTTTYAVTFPKDSGQYEAGLDAVRRAQAVLAEKAQQRVQMNGVGPRHILRQIETGRLDIEIDDVMALAYAEEFSAAQEKGAKALLQQAKASGPFPPSVAASIAHILARTLDAPVAVVDAFDRPERGDLTVQVKQVTLTEPSDTGTAGLITGTVDVELYRSNRHIPTDWDEVARALKAARVVGPVHEQGSDGDGGLVIDRARVVVNHTPAYGKVLLGLDLSDEQVQALAAPMLGKAATAIRHERSVCEPPSEDYPQTPTFTFTRGVLTAEAVYTAGLVSTRTAMANITGSEFGPFTVTKASAERVGDSRVTVRDAMGRVGTIEGQAIRVWVEARVTA